MSREDRKSEATIYRDVKSAFLFQTKAEYLHTPQGGTEVHAGNVAGAWARIVLDNPIAFPPSMEVTRGSGNLNEIAYYDLVYLK